MPKSSQSKKSGSTTWVLQRVTGTVLILLLLAHFWVHHFFIADFYGEMNVAKLPIENPTVTQQLQMWNPLFGKQDRTYIGPVLKELQDSNRDLYLHEDNVDGPTDVTVVDAPNRTALVRGHHDDLAQLSEALSWSMDDVELQQITVQPDQFSTKTMINHGDVQDRVSNIWWKAYNLLFLVLGLYHGFIGVWDVILDYKMGTLTRMTLWGALFTFAVILLIVGSLIIVPMGL